MTQRMSLWWNLLHRLTWTTHRTWQTHASLPTTSLPRCHSSFAPAVWTSAPVPWPKLSKPGFRPAWASIRQRSISIKRRTIGTLQLWTPLTLKVETSSPISTSTTNFEQADLSCELQLRVAPPINPSNCYLTKSLRNKHGFISSHYYHSYISFALSCKLVL